jgi:hypothetical protein
MYLPSDLSTLSPNLTNVLLEIEKRLIRLEKYVAAPPVTPDMLSRLRDDWRRDLRAAIGEPGYRDWEEVFGSPTVVSRGGMTLRPVSPSSLTVEATAHLQQPGCRLTNSVAQVLTNDTFTAIAFDTQRWQRGGIHSTTTNNTRITISDTGKWLVGGNLGYEPHATGRRMILIRVDGTVYETAIANPGFAPSVGLGNLGLATNTVLDLTAGQYVELIGYQSSGGDLDILKFANMSPEFWAIYLGR